MMSRAVESLSLALGAGKLAVGYMATKESVLQNRASLVVFTLDIADGTFEKVLRFIGEIPYMKIPYSQDDIENVMKRRFVVAAINDINFKRLFEKALKEDI